VANFRAAVWFLAGMQLHWFLNQNCNLGLDWTNHKLRKNVNSDMFLSPFPFKWNCVFCLKRCRFIHYLRKKEKKKREGNRTVLFWRHCGSSSSPGCVKQGKKKIFLPLSPSSLPSKRCWLPFKKTPTNPTCQRETFHVLEGWWRGGSTVATPAMSLPCFCNRGGEEKKWDRIEREEGKEKKTKRREEKRARVEKRGKRLKKKRRRCREKNEKQRRVEEEGAAPPAAANH